jgi:hypothetical protein
MESENENIEVPENAQPVGVGFLGTPPGYNRDGTKIEVAPPAPVAAPPEGIDRVLTRKDIMKITTFGVVKHYIPILKACVFVRVATAEEHWDMAAWVTEAATHGDKAEDMAEYRGRYAAMVLSDEKGNREWKDEEWREIIKRFPEDALEDIHEFGKALNNNTLEESEKN